MTAARGVGIAGSSFLRIDGSYCTANRSKAQERKAGLPFEVCADGVRIAESPMLRFKDGKEKRGNFRFFTPGDFAVYGVSNRLGRHLGVTAQRSLEL